MKIGDITEKIRHCSSCEITFHIYDRGSGQSKNLVMTPAQMFSLQSKDDRAYPFAATLESIDYIQGKLIINGSLRRNAAHTAP